MKIIIDTDIGDDIDDAFAIELALHSPELEITGVTTVFRNAARRAKIVEALLDAESVKIPVYAGRDRPLDQEIIRLVYEESVGRDADGQVNVPHYDPAFGKYGVKGGAEDFLLSQAEKYPGEITLLCLAPLTNVAAAYRKNPQSFAKFRGIVMMGGQANGDFAEWNFRCDPEAAKTVFDSGIPIKMIGINVTKHCSLGKSEIEEIFGWQSAGGKLLAKMLAKWLRDNRNEKLPVMHDPLATAELTESFCRYKVKSASVSLTGETRAMICEGSNPVEMATEVDREKFIGYFFNRLRGLA